MANMYLSILKKAIYGAVLVLFASSAWADEGGAVETGRELQVIVGPGAGGLDPLALPALQCVDGASAGLCKNLGDVLRRNVLLTFLYDILPQRSYLVDANEESLAEPRYPDWNRIGARWLIKGRLSGSGPYQLSLRLYNVIDKAEVPVKMKDFSRLGKDELNQAVRSFVNHLLYAQTGHMGSFDKRIAYSFKVKPGVKAIGVRSVDGFDYSSLANNGSINTLPSWGFGGILYTSFLDEKPDLFFGKKKLTRDGGHYRKAAVSPDGSRMVASVSYGGQSDLYLLSPDGSPIKNLTNTAYDEVSPSFSPDGSKIAYVSNQAGGPQIYVMNVDGSGKRRLTHAGKYNYAPDWGKNGLIVFASMEGNTSDIFTVDEGGSVRRLTQNQGFNKDPSWSADGRYVTFVSTRSAGSGIYVMSSDGRYQSLVTKGGGFGNTAWER